MGLGSFVDRGIEDDGRKFRAFGIDAAAAESLPYYARWIREDLIAVVYLLNRVATLIILSAVLVAIPLWMLALR
jgi:hypothetical protein